MDESDPEVPSLFGAGTGSISDGRQTPDDCSSLDGSINER